MRREKEKWLYEMETREREKWEKDGGQGMGGEKRGGGGYGNNWV